MKKFLFLSILFLASNGYAQEVLPISIVQGDGYASPYANKNVTVEGIVTANAKRGFYIQTPDNKVDANPKTSEGIYVFTKDEPSAEIVPGALVTVRGRIEEYRPKKAVYSLFLTEIVEPNVKVISKGNEIPKATKLTVDDLKPDGQIDQLERFEGMLVAIDSLTTVSPTGGFYIEKEDKTVSDGVFWGVLPEIKRPFREPGLDVLQVLIDKLPRDRPAFDMNPEKIRIDSNGLKGGRTIDVTSGAIVHALTGVMDYSSGAYTVLLNDRPVISNIRSFVPVSAANPGQISVAGMNLENFFDDKKNSNAKAEELVVSTEHFEKRLKKISLAIRKVLSLPDAIGVIEMENMEAFQRLVDRVNADVVAEGGANPQYKPYLFTGNDFRGINVGLMVKDSKLEVLKTEQLAKNLKFDFPSAFGDEMLFDRPPLLAQLRLRSNDANNAFQFTLIVNHFKSYRDIDQPRVQHKRRQQAEFLARAVSERTANDPLEKIVVLGDFNSFQFPDGYNDLIGTLMGKPSKEVLAPAQLVSETGLIDLVYFINEQNRYSYIYDGNAQAIDHILVNKMMQPFAASFGYSRVNADFPLVYENDGSRPERYSDHDVPVLFLDTKVSPQK